MRVRRASSPRAEHIAAAPSLVLRGDDGGLLPLDPARWHGPPTLEERRMVAGLRGPVLDVGCGPGRILERVAQRGLPALGVDPAAGAVALARQRGCSVLQRSVFAPLPGEGRWLSVLLLDGNLGIGGDPVRLLWRCRSIAHAEGAILAEVEPPGARSRTCRARLERGAEVGAWFAWAVVGADAIDELSLAAGLHIQQLHTTSDGRWFARLVRATVEADACA